MRLAKDARLSLPLTEVMKIVKLTSPLPDGTCQSSPRPRLRHGRRLALLFHPNPTQKLYTFFFSLLLALLPCLPLLICQLFFSQGIGFGLCRLPGSHFSVSQPKTLGNRAKGYLSELRRATCPEESHSSFCSLFSPIEILAAAANLSPSTATGPDKIACSMLKHLPRSGMDVLLHIFNLFCTSNSFPSIWKTSSIISIHKMGKSLDSPASFLPSFINAHKAPSCSRRRNKKT